MTTVAKIGDKFLLIKPQIMIKKNTDTNSNKEVERIAVNNFSRFHVRIICPNGDFNKILDYMSENWDIQETKVDDNNFKITLEDYKKSK